MKAFKSKTFDPVPMVKTSAKIKKLKKMMREKAEERGLAVWSGGKSMSKVNDSEVELIPVQKGFDPSRFDPKSLLHNELLEVVELLETARQTYRDLPDGENASSLSMLLREMRGFVGDLYQITQEDKDTLFKKINNEILEPFMTRVVKAIVLELDSIRKQLTMALGEDKNAEITSAIKTGGKNISPLLTMEYESMVKEMAKALSIGDVGDIIERLKGMNFAKKE